MLLKVDTRSLCDICSKLRIIYARTTSLTSFWCFYSKIWTDFTHCSCVYIVDFEQINAGKVKSLFKVNNKEFKTISMNMITVPYCWIWSKYFLVRYWILVRCRKWKVCKAVINLISSFIAKTKFFRWRFGKNVD